MQPLVECVPNFSDGRRPEVYTAIAEELFSQYDLGYMPLRVVADGGFRHVAVRLRPQTNALARTRTGYIASSARAAMAR